MRPMNLTNYLAISQNLIWYMVNLLLCMAWTSLFKLALSQLEMIPNAEFWKLHTFKGFVGCRTSWFFSLKNCPSSHPPGYQQVAKKSSFPHWTGREKRAPFSFCSKNSTKSTSTELDMALGLEHADLAFCMVVVAGLATSLGASAVFFHSCVARLVFFGRLMDGFCFLFEGCLDPTGRSWDVSKNG